jgi:hypothetical protein
MDIFAECPLSTGEFFGRLNQEATEQAKFRGPSVSTTSTFVNGEMVVRALNESNTLLIPFIVDPFGGLGPIANCFLCGLARPS